MNELVGTFPRISGGTEIVVTFHARQRIAEMRLDVDEVLTVLASPEVEYPGRPDQKGRPTRIAVGGRLAVVATSDRSAVLTVLWHGAEGRVAA